MRRAPGRVGFSFAVAGVVACGSLLGLDDVRYVGDAGASGPSDTTAPVPDAEGGSSGAEGGPADAVAPSLPTHLYVIGGWAGSAVNVDVADVDFAEIMSDGSLGPWTPTTPLQTPASLCAGAAGPVSVLLAGGQESGMLLGNVLEALVGDGGALGTWASEKSFGPPRFRSGVASSGGFLYVLGGATYPSDATTNGTIADVEYALENSDGSIGLFETTTSLPLPRQRFASTASDAHIFVTAGNDKDLAILGDVLMADRNADGSLRAWRDFTSLGLTTRYLHQAVVYDHYLLVIGGMSGSGAFLNDVQIADFSSGSLAIFNAAPTSPWVSRQGLGAVVVGDTLYIVGGDSGTTPYQSDVWYTKLGSGAQPAAWTQGPSLPSGRAYFGFAAR